MRIAIQHPQAARVTVAVNGVVIPAAAIAREVQNHPEDSPQAAWAAATRAVVVRELLLQRAHALGLVAEPRSEEGMRETEDEALIRALLEAEIHTPRADEATCRRYHAANRARFRGPDLYEPLHILFRADRNDRAAFALALSRAQAVLEEIRTCPNRFEDFARTLSDCPSAEAGGRLGQVTSGQTTPEFEDALRRLRPGETGAELVETRYGIHLVRLERKAQGAELPFEQVHARLAAYLEERAWRRAVAQYVALLAGGAEVLGCDMAAATSPLLQ